ncbi:DUF1512 family protein [Candidatus Aenigmatarchaeota archaeon]
MLYLKKTFDYDYSIEEADVVLVGVPFDSTQTGSSVKNGPLFIREAIRNLPGKAVEKVIKNNDIKRIITIDAAAKLEGEKTGSLAEGVGVAMGGPGVERSYIENIVVKKNIPLDSIIIKMGQEEAIMPMRKAIKDALPEVRKSIKRSLERTKRGDKIVIVGVGNTSGVGNSGKDIEKVSKWVDSYENKMKKMMKEKKKKGIEDLEF